MIKKRIVIYTLLFTLPLNFGCTSLTLVQKESWRQIKNEENKTDEILLLTKGGYKYNIEWESISVSEDSLFGAGYQIAGEDRIPFQGAFAFEEIHEIKKDEFSLTSTLGLVGFLGLVVLGLLLLGSSGMGGGMGSGTF